MIVIESNTQNYGNELEYIEFNFKVDMLILNTKELPENFSA